MLPQLTLLLFSEATRFQKKMGDKLPRWQEKLISYEQQNLTDGNLFVHFSIYPRMGLFLVNQHDTPIGFYSYSINRKTISNFATNRPYAIVFRPKTTAKVLVVSKYTDKDFAADLEKLKRVSSIPNLNGYQGLPAKKLWELTKQLSGFVRAPMNPSRGGGPTGKWTYLLWKVLGYDGILDDGYGVIYFAQKHQAVWFNTTQLEILDVLNKSKGEESDDYDEYDSTNPFMEKNLSGKDFSNSQLEEKDWEGITASNTNFSNSTLIRINFENANLQFSNFQGAKLVGCDFTRARLSSANFRDANLIKCKFGNANLSGTDFSTTINFSDSYKAGAIYSSKTKFPPDFSLEFSAMEKID